MLVKSPEHFVKETMVLPLSEEKSGIRVDFVFSTSLYERAALQRVRKVKIGRSKVSFASLEDVVIHKLIAARPRDMEDVRGILLRNRKYDKIYIEKWLKEFDRLLDQNSVRSWKEMVKETNA